MNFNTIPNSEKVQKTAQSLKDKGYEAVIVQNESEALEKIKALIPQKASVMNGASVTLEQIGFVDYLKANEHGWDNVHEHIVKEQDKTKQAELRKQAILSEYYLGSVHALAETGEFLIASNTGSQLPHIVYSSTHLIFVVGTQKIVSTLMEGMQRLDEHIMPLEEKHMQEKYGVGTHQNKVLFFKGESPMTGRKITFILINKVLGF